MKRRILTFAVMLVTALTFGGCTSKTEPTTTVGTEARGQAELAPDSILLFGNREDAAKLVADMQAGNIPTKCEALYDVEGSLPPVEVTDENAIRELYDSLAQVCVGDKSNTYVTDSYHYVVFELQDGTRVPFNFLGEGLTEVGKEVYDVKGGGSLWAHIRNLQAEITGDNHVYLVNLQDEAGVVLECPTNCAERSEVWVLCSTEKEGTVHVYANSEEVTRKYEISAANANTGETTPLNQTRFVFTMPASDVEVLVTLEP